MPGSAVRMLDVSDLMFLVLAGRVVPARHLSVGGRAPATFEGGGYRLPPGYHV